MKRFLALAALVLGLAACQTEPEGLNVNVGGEVDTVVSVSLPEATRATSDVGFNIADTSDNYEVRYILEIYLGEKCQRHIKVADGASVAFPVRLAPDRDYTFVAWADIVEKNNDRKEMEKDRYYNTQNGLDQISIIENTEVKWNAMDESRDAFTAKETRTGFSAQAVELKLKRPFAKLRVVATDLADVVALGLTPATATITYSQAMPCMYNALEQEVTNVEETNRTHTITYDVENHVYTDNKGEFTLFADYFFADDVHYIAKFSLDVYAAADDTTPIKHTDFNTDIHVAANKLTTIKGDVLTTGTNISIDIEGNGQFDEEKVYEIVEVYNATELQEAINEADDDTVIVLANDIVLGATASTLSTRSASNNSITVEQGTTATIELNGNTISTQWSDEAAKKHYYAIYNYGNLTIKDSGENGAIVSRGIYNYGTMTLESGKIDACDANGGYAVKNEPNATFVMNGGSVVTSNEDGDAPEVGKYDATTIRVDEGATATINGGVVNNVSNYTFAIDNYGTTTINGGTFTSIHSTVSSYGTMTINGGSFIRKGLNGVSGHALIVWNGSNTTINGGTFDGQGINNGYNVYADEGALVEINGGNFLKAYIASLYGAGTINVKGGTFFDDPSKRVVKGYVAEKNGDVFVVSKIALEANFADNSWDKIILACQNDIVLESWAVGDKKEMTIGGNTYEIAIIGKNHDTYTGGTTKAPLTFQLFEMYATNAQMNETEDNTTGWSGSKMRNTTMTEILNVMPEAVKNAIKAVDKVSLNGSKSALETTSDKLFLLSEIEVNGSSYWSGGFVEGSRYAYYTNQIWDSNNNLSSQIMQNKYDRWTVSWYLRTPKNDNGNQTNGWNTRFIAINGSGIPTNITAEIASGVVFGFCF